MKKICILFCLLLLRISFAYGDDGDSMNVELLSSTTLSADDIIYYNNFIYMEMDIYDVSNPLSPIYVGEIDDGINSYAFNIHNNILFVLDGEIHVYDLTDPDDPNYLSTYTTRNSAQDIEIQGNTAYVADNEGLAVLNTSNPENITEENYIDVSGYDLLKIKVCNNHVYILSNDRLYIYDLSTPLNPSLSGSCEYTGSAYGLDVSGDYAFIGGGGVNGLRIIDITNSSNPVEVGSCISDRTPYDIKIVDNFAYVASSYSGISILNIDNPLNPILTGYYDSPGITRKIDVINNIVYACYQDYFHIYDCSAATDDSPPDAFNLLTPANNATITSDEVNLTWSESSDDVYKYVLYTATNSSFTQNVDSVDVDDTEYTFDGLIDNTTYWWKVRAQNANSAGTWSTQTWAFDVQQSDVPESGQLPQEYAVTAVYPNPFNPVLNIEITLPTPEKVQINVFNVLGEFVKRVVFDLHSSGRHNVELDANNLSSGVYYVSVKIPGKFNHFEKVVLLK